MYLSGKSEDEIILSLTPVRVVRPRKVINKINKKKKKRKKRAKKKKRIVKKVMANNADVFKSAKSKWDRYRHRVKMLTEQNDLSVLTNYDKRGFRDYHLDHKVSVWYGFKNGIPEEEIAGIGNLRFIPCRENMDKNTDCYWDLFNCHLRGYSGQSG